MLWIGIYYGGIMDLQKKSDRVTDTTINYFYALYVLSKCDGFLASTLCNGVNIVRAFNEGRFECDDIVREMIIRGELMKDGGMKGTTLECVE